MSLKQIHFINALCCLLIASYCSHSLGESTLFYNGVILSDVNGRPLHHGWLLVKDGKVEQVGTGKLPKAEIKKDLQGRFVMPSLSDSHLHLVELGRSYYEVDLKGAKSEAEAVTRLSDFIKKHHIESTTPIGGTGWDQSDWPGQKFPLRTSLDAVSTTQPIALYRVDGHALWANTYALKHTTLWAPQEDPKGGKVFRDSQGDPEGVVLDNAMLPLEALLKVTNPADLEKYIVAAVHHALAQGITSLHDAGASELEIETVRHLLTQDKIDFRFNEMVQGSDEETLAYYLHKGKEIDAEHGMLTIGTVKLFADGAMGSRGAAFEEPYSDDPTNKGLMMMDEAEMVEKMKRIDQAGFQIAIHAIGDRANRIAINAMEKALGPNIRAKRPRLEHAQVLSKEDVARIGDLGIIASLQPIHCISDMKWVYERIGKKRARYSYAWNSLAEHGASIAFGSDAPVDDLNPWAGLFAAVTRQTPDFKPLHGFIPEERISLSDALNAYTLGSAYAAFQEKEAGSLEKGKWADFIILKNSPYQLSLKDLRTLKVEETYLAGSQVWPLPRKKQVKRTGPSALTAKNSGPLLRSRPVNNFLIHFAE